MKSGWCHEIAHISAISQTCARTLPVFLRFEKRLKPHRGKNILHERVCSGQLISSMASHDWAVLTCLRFWNIFQFNLIKILRCTVFDSNARNDMHSPLWLLEAQIVTLVQGSAVEGVWLTSPQLWRPHEGKPQMLLFGKVDRATTCMVIRNGYAVAPKGNGDCWTDFQIRLPLTIRLDLWEDKS